jgi:hypothetical protein
MNGKLFRILALAGLLAAPASAQLQAGNLYGTVIDENGQALPGATVTLAGTGAEQVQTTDAKGNFHFLGLSPAQYTVKAELDRYAAVEWKDIVVSLGRNTQIEMTLASSDFGEIVDVKGDQAPLLDPHRFSVERNFPRVEMDKVPTARDPWAVLRSAPGVLIDRINNGGNESGQQASYVGPGSAGAQAVWSLDGMVITDMSAVGSSPGYFDFDSFQELQITTGGSDASVATGGVVVNMVTRRGTDQWRGSGRFVAGDDGTQSDLSLDRGDLGQAGPWNRDTAQADLKQGNRIVEASDYGAEIGGPLVAKRLWVWTQIFAPVSTSLVWPQSSTAASSSRSRGTADVNRPL